MLVYHMKSSLFTIRTHFLTPIGIIPVVKTLIDLDAILFMNHKERVVVFFNVDIQHSIGWKFVFARLTDISMGIDNVEFVFRISTKNR